jgi:hypothetical protein
MKPCCGSREDGWQKLHRLSWDDAGRCEHDKIESGPNEFWGLKKGIKPALTCMRAWLWEGARIGVLARVRAVRPRGAVRPRT